MLKHLIRTQYQAKLESLNALPALARPREGWVRTLRKALGMSIPQLASRLALGKAQISQIERVETEDRITLKQLRRVADALDCDLQYVFVPRKPIAEMVREQARQKAQRLVHKTHIQMMLEAQQLPPDQLQAQIEAETERLLREMPRDLWDD